MERAAREFAEQAEGSPRVWFQIVNGTLWVDHSLAPWPDLGWYPASIGGGARRIETLQSTVVHANLNQCCQVLGLNFSMILL